MRLSLLTNEFSISLPCPLSFYITVATRVCFVEIWMSFINLGLKTVLAIISIPITNTYVILAFLPQFSRMAHRFFLSLYIVVWVVPVLILLIAHLLFAVLLYLALPPLGPHLLESSSRSTSPGLAARSLGLVAVENMSSTLWFPILATTTVL